MNRPNMQWFARYASRIAHRASLLLILIFALALALRVGIALPELDNVDRFQTGDYDLYRYGAEDFLLKRDFTNSLFLPRPPLFALMIAALGLNDVAVIIANTALGALSAPLTYPLARQLGLPMKVALAAALVVALDPTGVLFSSFLGPEPLANLLLLLGVAGALTAVTSEKRRSWWWAALGGLALLLSSLTRPATYLLWMPLGAWLLLTNRRQWAAVGIVALVNVLGVAGWTLHNGVVFHHYTFSSIAPYTMLYYRAAAVEHLATGRDMDAVYTDINCQVERRMGRDCANVVPEWRDRYLSSSPELANALQSVAIDIFRAHPLVYVATLPVGFARMYGLLPNPDKFSDWTTYPFLVWNAAFLLGTLAGLGLAFRRKQWMLFWSILLVGAYYTVGTLAVKSAGMDTRERSMLTPFMAVAWVYALALWLEARKNTKRRFGVPVHGESSLSPTPNPQMPKVDR